MPATFKKAALPEENWRELFGLIEKKSKCLHNEGDNLKFKCPVGVVYLPVSALWKQISIIPTDKKLGQMK